MGTFVLLRPSTVHIILSMIVYNLIVFDRHIFVISNYIVNFVLYFCNGTVFGNSANRGGTCGLPSDARWCGGRGS